MGAGVRRDERSSFFSLTEGRLFGDQKIVSLRFKGNRPHVDFDEEGRTSRVRSYVDGSGYVHRHLTVDVDSPGSIVASNKTEADYSPDGSMDLFDLSVEVETALMLGPYITDRLLGFGIFIDLFHHNEPVGYAVYGMERYEDERVSPYLAKYRRSYQGWPQETATLLEKIGKKLMQAHQRGVWFGYPHLGNFAPIRPAEIRLLDLDTARALPNNLEATVAALYLDTSEVLSKLERGIDGNYPVPALVPYFLRGYLGEIADPEFARQLTLALPKKENSFMEESAMYDEDSAILVTPRRTLENLQSDRVALKDYTGDSRLFSAFYRQLVSCAHQILNPERG
jgi:hypothetical protein